MKRPGEQEFVRGFRPMKVAAHVVALPIAWALLGFSAHAIAAEQRPPTVLAQSRPVDFTVKVATITAGRLVILGSTTRPAVDVAISGTPDARQVRCERRVPFRRQLPHAGLQREARHQDRRAFGAGKRLRTAGPGAARRVVRRRTIRRSRSRRRCRLGMAGGPVQQEQATGCQFSRLAVVRRARHAGRDRPRRCEGRGRRPGSRRRCRTGRSARTDRQRRRGWRAGPAGRNGSGRIHRPPRSQGRSRC